MRAALFITCVADAIFPEVGESVVRLLRRHGVEVDFPLEQTCCGQPAYNAGYHHEARAVARQLLRALEGYEYVVTPSGSCAAMVRHYYPHLFEGEPEARRAEELCRRLYEFSEFMVRVLGVTDVGAEFPARATYHSSCHMSRGLGVREEPRLLLSHVRGLELVDLPYAHECCGFGGTFSVKLPEVSTAMADEKLQHVAETGAEILIGSDLACLWHLGGRLSRLGRPVRTMHVAQVLDEGLRRTG